MLTFEFNNKSKQEFLKYLKGLEGEILSIVKGEIEDSLLKIESEATKKVKVDTGALKNSIQSTPIKQSKTKVEGGVFVGANYAPYVEFGTGTEVEVPSELTQFAKQFKGKGKKKVNLPARPFFILRFINNELNYQKTLKNLLKFS